MQVGYNVHMEPIAQEINLLLGMLAVKTEQRNELIYREMLAGGKPRVVAERYDLTRQRVEQIYEQFVAMEQSNGHNLAG